MGKAKKNKKNKKKVSVKPTISLESLPVGVDSMEELEFVEKLANLDWKSLVELYGKDWVSEDFIRRHWVDGIGNKAVSGRGNLSPEFIEEFKDRINWYVLLESQQFDEVFLEKYHNRLNHYMLCLKQNFSESFAVRHPEMMDELGLIDNNAMPPEVKANILGIVRGKTE